MVVITKREHNIKRVGAVGQLKSQRWTLPCLVQTAKALGGWKRSEGGSFSLNETRKSEPIMPRIRGMDQNPAFSLPDKHFQLDCK